jgi:hypothetical protein
MKIESDIKSTKETGSETGTGDYTLEDLDEMLKTVIKAKEIQSDEKTVRLLKDYASSKARHIDQLFINPQKDAMVGLDKIKVKAQNKANELADEEDED